MPDAPVFTRFIYEMRTLLTAIESHTISLSAATPVAQRPVALREMARLARATAELAQAFEVDDLSALAHALASASSQAVETSEAVAFAPIGAHDTLHYMKWRIEQFAERGDVQPLSEHDRHLALRLERTLRDGSRDTPTERAATSEEYSFAGASELTLDDLELIQTFAGAPLRQRDAQADARRVARMTGTPIFTARTESGEDVPVFGGPTPEDDDILKTLSPDVHRIFCQETQTDIRNLGKLMLEFEQRPADLSALADMEFIGHKIKGAAATLNFIGLAKIAEAFQRTILARQASRATTDSAFLTGLGRFLDLFERGLIAVENNTEPAPALIEEAEALRDELTRGHGSGEITRDESGPYPTHPISAGLVGTRRRHSEGDLVLRVEARKLDMLMNQLSALAANRGAVARNRGEIIRAQEEMRETLQRLREKSAQISDSHPLTFDNLLTTARTDHALSAQSARSADMPPDPAATPSGFLRTSWTDLEMERYTEIDSALRALTEAVADVTANYGMLASLIDRLGQLTETQEGLARDIQEDAMDMRLARLGEIMPRVRLSVLVAAKNMGKLTDFEARGEDVEIDRSLLEALENPLIQLMRNAVAHGIEQPLERAEAGKSARGKVWLHAYTSGSTVVIDVGDDGRGVNENLLIAAAIGAQLISAEEARDLTPEQALSLMFKPGISTSGVKGSGYVGALAGSGIGLANVIRNIHELKGSITVRSTANHGTVFRIRVPVSLSMQQVLEVQAGGAVFALPFAMVRSTGIVAPERLREWAPEPSASRDHVREWRLTIDNLLDDTLEDVEALTPADEETDDRPMAPQTREIPAFALAELLGFEQDASKLQHMALALHHGELVAFLVEAVGDADVREAAVRPLPKRFQRRVVRGIVVRPEDGEVALLVDLHEALAQRLSGAEIILRPASAVAESRAPSPTVLIVDDSVTIRHSLEQILTAAGFKTSQASDGREALEVMDKELPAVVILDVEMPRLSGFELLTVMRSSPQYQQVRVAMLTTRAADKHRNYALAIGADAYLVKPCPQETLVETIRRLLTESEPG